MDTKKKLEAKFCKKTIDAALVAMVPDNSVTLKSIIKNNGVREDLIIDKNDKADSSKEKSGVYIFWWDLEKANFIDSKNRFVIEKVPKKSLDLNVVAKITDDWVDVATHKNKICLYVGKTTNLRSRMSGHLKLKSPKNGVNSERLKKNTESQMRLALETLTGKNMMNEILENVSVTYHIMRSYSESINRFYVENALIGKYNPLFNVDIER